MIEYQIRIDVKGQRTLYTDGVFTTGDVQAYRLRFLFYDDGAPYDVSGCSLVLRGKRSDGVVISDVGHIEADGTAYYDVSGSLYAVAGSLSVEVALTGAADEYLTAKELIFNVRGGHGDGDPATEDTAPMISKLLEEIKQTADDVGAVQSALNEKVDKETGKGLSANDFTDD
ncbi:MAG: BppU family phage baseplate upper protein [Clostridia bacterium]